MVKIAHKIGAVSVYWGLIVIDIIKRYYSKEGEKRMTTFSHSTNTMAPILVGIEQLRVM